MHQVLEQLQRHGCEVQFFDRPMSQDPQGQLLLQIHGAIAPAVQRLSGGTLINARRAIKAARRCPSSFAVRKCAPAQIRLSAHSFAKALRSGKCRVSGLGRSAAVKATGEGNLPGNPSMTRAPVAQSVA
jgi:hypothetical protein